MDVWSRCLERLEAEFPPEDVHTWLKPLQADVRDDATVLYAPNAFIVEQVRERYLPRIRELVHYFAGHADVGLEIGSRPKPVEALPPPPSQFAAAPAPAAAAPAPEAAKK